MLIYGLDNYQGLAMKKLFLALLILPMTTAIAEDVTTDYRHVVEMPTEMKTLFLKNMRGHMESLDRIIAALAENDLTEAAAVAEAGMGAGHGKQRQCEDGAAGQHKHEQSSHQTKSFGQFMPKEMKMMGMQLHIAVNEFADTAREGDIGEAYKSLRNISASCVACHQSFQVK